MKAVILPSYNDNIIRALLSLKTEEIATIKPGPNEVLVELYAAACNPSDIAFIRGGYNIIKPVPAIPGFEASGKIIACGKNAENLLGRNISCFVQAESSGTWAEQFIVDKNDLIVLNDKMDLNQGAGFSVNPFTAFGMIEIAKKRGSKAILQNAAGGQVAEFIRKLAEENGIEVINIVRKNKTADKLNQEGEKYVLSEQDDDFTENLIAISNKLKPSTAFDAVGGILAGQMLNAMQDDAELVVYGGLSGSKISEIDTMDIIFRKKIISGFNLIDWKNEMSEEDFIEISEILQEKFISGYLQTRFQATTNFENIIRGLTTYIKNMSSGKLLIKP